MLNASKKKPRQRNRARNKSKRAQDVHNGKIERDSESEESAAEPTLAPSIQNSEPEVEKCNVEAVANVSDITKQLPLATANNQVAPTALFEHTDALKMIQQMMRAKLLKQSANNESVKDVKDDKDRAVKDNKLSQETGVPPKDSNTGKAKKSVNANECVATIKKSKSKEKIGENITEQSAFIANLQKKMESAIANGGADLPNALLDNLQKLFNQDPISDVESSDDEDEYIEYVYKPRQYFLVSLCNFCKCDLTTQTVAVPCKRCHLTYYCKAEHMKCDTAHRQLCYALQQVADSCGGNIFRKCADFTTEQFRSYRIVTVRQVESIINRPLTAAEQEVILFPRICGDINCRESHFKKLVDCNKCGQVAYCKEKPEHFPKTHNLWCKAYQLFKSLILFQEKFGRLEPSLPTKILKDIPGACCNTRQILSKLSFDMQDPCEYAALSQVSTCPLTAWYALKLCGQLKKSEVMTIHLIGAEIEFEVDVLHKWELFFLHITPTVKELNVVFVGPELNPGNISFEQLKKNKCCRACRKNGRTVKYHFQSQLYHEYCNLKTFMKPDLICFFNAGLYRFNGFQMDDTWPDTILAAANLKCPVVVTSYTEYETPLDMARFVQESNRSLLVILPPTMNPFASEKPERNFISDDVAPLMFKNYYCFVVE